MNLPMKCLKRKEPFSSRRHLFEPKVDGLRCRLITKTGEGLVELDGEVAVLDSSGVPRLHLVQQRGQSDPLFLRTAMRDYPALFFGFDILHYRGSDINLIPLKNRKRLLTDVWPGLRKNGVRLYSKNGHDMTARFPELADPRSYRLLPWVEGDGEALFRKLCEAGWEGIVGKELDSPYLFDSRTKLWIASKRPKIEGDFIICGATKGKGNREGLIGSLILGEPTDKGLIYVGEVGTGLCFADLRKLTEKFTRKDACPFNDRPKIEGFWFWSAPKVVAEIAYYERTVDKETEAELLFAREAAADFGTHKEHSTYGDIGVGAFLAIRWGYSHIHYRIAPLAPLLML